MKRRFILELKIYNRSRIKPIKVHVIEIILKTEDCRLLVTRFNRIQFKHCYKKANQCKDNLARMGISNNLDLTYFDSPSADVVSVFKNGFNGMYFKVNN